MKRNFKLMCALSLATALLAACGGGDDEPPIVAASDAVVAADAGSVVATQGAPFTFGSGVPSFGTTSTTTVAFSGTGTTPSFKIEEGSNSAEGVTRFGSCIFDVVTSNFTPPHPLSQGSTITVEPCNIRLDTDGMNANGTELTVEMQLQLGTQLSLAIGAEVAITATGEVILNGQPVGTVQVTPVTGGGG